jgi:CheY-like chemotaxis protein
MGAGERRPRSTGENVAEQTLWPSAPLVLVAEDSPLNQALAIRVLERCGCRAEVAASGVEALAMLASRRYDAVLMDCQMPQMDGYTATAEVRRREGGDRRTPIIALTAYALDGNRERCIESGMDDYISKPVHRDLLLETLRRWLPPSGGVSRASRTGAGPSLAG